jgi:prepilin-type processing-associated H-X9-DG protein
MPPSMPTGEPTSPRPTMPAAKAAITSPTPERVRRACRPPQPNTEWRDTSLATGICFQRSEVRFAEITDGLSNTYLFGEKYVSRDGYDSAEDPGHDQSLYSGVDWDVNRWGLDPPLPDSDFVDPRSFGSAHSGACQMAFCDGSVRSVSYSIDAETHRRLGNRRDGLPMEVP